jgi:hypothetical protein
MARSFILPDAGAMSYMMSKQGHPHVMLYLGKTDAAAILSQAGTPELAPTFFIPVA